MSRSAALLRSRWLRRSAIAAGLALAGVAAVFLANRCEAPQRHVTRHGLASPAAPIAVGPGWRIGAWNVAHARGRTRHDWQGGDAAERRERLAQMAQQIARLELDVLVLNEVDFDSSWSRRTDQARILAERAGFPYRVEQRNHDAVLPGWRWQEGNAVLSRHPIRAADPIELPARQPLLAWLGIWKRAVGVTVERADGSRLRVVAIHLDHRDEDVRIASAARILDWARDARAPVVLAGDFNSTPSGYPKAKQSRAGGTALDRLLASGFQRAPGIEATPEHMTYRADRPDRIIDWILAPPGWRFLRHEVVPSLLSDHRLVWAELAPQ